MSTLTELCFLPATELVSRMRRKDVSAVEVMDAHLARIEAVNPKVNAIVTLDADGAREAARRADESLARGDTLGPLHGLPVAHKDLVLTRGMRTTFGSPIFRDFVPEQSSILVERQQRAGAITLGKTNTPEFGAGSQTFNTVFGATRNPYDLDEDLRRQQRRRGRRARVRHGGARGRLRSRRFAPQSGKLLQCRRAASVDRARAAVADRRRVEHACGVRPDGAHRRGRRPVSQRARGIRRARSALARRRAVGLPRTARARPSRRARRVVAQPRRVAGRSRRHGRDRAAARGVRRARRDRRRRRTGLVGRRRGVPDAARHRLSAAGRSARHASDRLQGHDRVEHRRRAPLDGLAGGPRGDAALADLRAHACVHGALRVPDRAGEPSPAVLDRRAVREVDQRRPHAELPRLDALVLRRSRSRAIPRSRCRAASRPAAYRSASRSSAATATSSTC